VTIAQIAKYKYKTVGYLISIILINYKNANDKYKTVGNAEVTTHDCSSHT